MPIDRGTGKTARSRLGLPPRRFPTNKKIFGSLRWAASELPGGKEMFLSMCEIAAREGSTPCEAIVVKYASLSKLDQQKVSLDDITEALNLRAADVLGDVVKTMFQYSMDVSKMLAYVAQPAIVERVIANAKKADPDFHNDRKLALTATGFVQPQPLVHLDLRRQTQPDPPEPDGSGMETFEQRVRKGAQTLRKDG